MKVALLHDQLTAQSGPDDLDILAQLDAIEAALAQGGHAPVRIACTLDLESLRRELVREQPRLVFNLVESLGGHGRLVHVVPGLLDSMGIAYTGASAEAIFTTSCKPLAKQMLVAEDLPTPPWLTATGAGDVGRGPLPRRMIIKSVWEHASRGLDDDSVVTLSSAAALLAEVRRRAGLLGGEAFAEEYIEGREFNISLLEGEEGVDRPEVLPPAEMRFEGIAAGRPRIVGYRAKWESESPDYQQTVRSFGYSGSNDAAMLGQIEALAVRCWRAFGLRGYARVDFRVDESGRPWILEVNANPCLSPDAGFAAALECAEVSFNQAIARIVWASPGAQA
jgi:D-alanine-D-alanine ligase